MLRRALGPLATRTLHASPSVRPLAPVAAISGPLCLTRTPLSQALLASALTSITRSCDAGGAAVHEACSAPWGGRGFTASAAQCWAFPPLPRDLTPPKHSFNQVCVLLSRVPCGGQRRGKRSR